MEKTYIVLTTRGSDILTEGRQTWDPISKRSIPSALAYFTTVDMMEANLGNFDHTIIGFINAYFKLFSLKTLNFQSEEWTGELVWRKK